MPKMKKNNDYLDGIDDAEDQELNMKKRKKKKYKLKKQHVGVAPRIVVYSIFIFCFVVGSFFCIRKALSTVTTHQFFYTETSNLDYKTCLKENEYFTEKCLDKGNQYIASLIEYIDAEFKYNFNSSNVFDYKYKYSINAKIVATEKNDSSKVLYEKSEVLLEEKTGNMKKSNSFVINEKVKIDYIKYNKLMTSFRKDYTLTLDSNLIITLNVVFDGDYDHVDDKIETEQNISLTIPLSEQTLDIRMNYKDINNSETLSKKTNDELINKLFYGLGALFGLSTLVVIILLIKFVNKISVPKSNYTKKLEKIMKEFNQIIVETKKAPAFDDAKIFEIDSFEELLDVRETILKPILFIKISNEKSYFIISNGEEVYRYVLKAVDLE